MNELLGWFSVEYGVACSVGGALKNKKENTDKQTDLFIDTISRNSLEN